MAKAIKDRLTIGVKTTIIIVLLLSFSILTLSVITLSNANRTQMSMSFDQLDAVRAIKTRQIQELFRNAMEDLATVAVVTSLEQQKSFETLKAIHNAKKQLLEVHLRENPFNAEDFQTEGRLSERVAEIFGDRTGLGVSGESYIVEFIGDRIYFRSNLVTLGNGSFVSGYDLTDIAPSYIREIQRGESGADVFTDTSGALVMVQYSPVEASGINLGIVTKYNLEEALSAEIEGLSDDYYTNFIDSKGYYDLFLIHPSGSIFYSVGQEADYGTNILTGEYRDSSLNRAVSEAISTQDIAFGDFRPYEPSGNQPAAFVAIPLMHHGSIELIVALQLSITRINQIMQERTGMGESGETYLVGSDRLMRSDSFLDPVNHSVVASFANPTLGSVRTEASLRALNQETARDIIIDYNGNPVLSSFEPVHIFDTTWAILAEIDEREIRAPILRAARFIIISALMVLVLSVVLSVLYSRSLSAPIKQLMKGAMDLSKGDIALSNVDMKKFAGMRKRRDEIGSISNAFSELIEYQRNKSDVAKAIASKNLVVDVSLSSEKDELGRSFRDMLEALKNLIGIASSASSNVSSGSDQVSLASQELSSGATEQASSIEEISSAMSEVSSQASVNAKNATEAMKVASDAKERANEGLSEMKELLSIMSEINESAAEISSVVKIIDDIAFQINLLALNANVEAARAGKYGKGFAVVADEVRNLANRSAEAVKSTAQMVSQTVSAIQRGNTATQNTDRQLDGIVEAIAKVAIQLQEIMDSSQEQAQVINQAAKGLDQISETTQSTTASAEESAAASEQLASQAMELRSIISEFTVEESEMRLIEDRRS